MASGTAYRAAAETGRQATIGSGSIWRRIIACVGALSMAAAGSLAPAAEPERYTDDAAIARAIRHVAQPLTGSAADYDRLLARVGDARLVLLGEDTHGSREFYRERARITRRLIEEQGFAGIVIEADWSEAAQLRPYLGDPAYGADAGVALRAFERFPRWMWRNTDFRDLVRWLRAFNLQRAARAHPVLIHGMDLYEIPPAIATVTGWLDLADPDAAARARLGYACLDNDSAGSPDDAGATPPRWPDRDCSAAAQAPLTEMMTASPPSGAVPDLLADSAWIDALQSARVVRAAEEYFRAMRHPPDISWNLRDTHMAATVDLLLAHLDAVTGTRARLVVWAHNAHVGDARATARGDAGGLTLGQLLRERYPDDTVSIGFLTAAGSVRAATDWGGPDVRKTLRRPLPHSHAALLRRTGRARFYLDLGPALAPPLRAALTQARPQRGVGVRYLPALEVAGHYYMARLPRQFDAAVFIARTTALRPLPRER